jgi:hypothetical protein
LALDSSALVIRELTADARLTGARATLLKERIQDTNRVRDCSAGRPAAALSNGVAPHRGRMQ